MSERKQKRPMGSTSPQAIMRLVRRLRLAAARGEIEQDAIEAEIGARLRVAQKAHQYILDRYVKLSMDTTDA